MIPTDTDGLLKDAGGARPTDSLDDSALALALEFHRTYELLAPNFGYKTQMATRVFDPDSPNGRLMIAVCAEILARRAKRIQP